ncbi:hypothetical protein Tco_0374938 [Tanacetum coccineum]
MPKGPKKKIIRSIGEGGSSTRVSKIGSQGSCSNFKKPRHNKASYKEPILEQTPKPKGVSGRPIEKQSVVNLEDVYVDVTMRDRGAGGSKGGGSKGGANTYGSKKGSSCGSKQSSVGVGGSKGCADEPEQTQDDPVQTQDDPVHTQDDPMQTQDKDQVEQTQEQAEIDLTQVEQTQEQTQDQVQTQEQLQQVTLRRPSARTLQKKLGKQGSSQNTAFYVE